MEGIWAARQLDTRPQRRILLIASGLFRALIGLEAKPHHLLAPAEGTVPHPSLTCPVALRSPSFFARRPVDIVTFYVYTS